MIDSWPSHSHIPHMDIGYSLTLPSPTDHSCCNWVMVLNGSHQGCITWPHYCACIVCALCVQCVTVWQLALSCTKMVSPEVYEWLWKIYKPPPPPPALFPCIDMKVYYNYVCAFEQAWWECPRPLNASTDCERKSFYNVDPNFLFLQSTRDESSLDRHTYSILEAGLYVPTEVCQNKTW